LKIPHFKVTGVVFICTLSINNLTQFSKWNGFYLVFLQVIELISNHILRVPRFIYGKRIKYLWLYKVYLYVHLFVFKSTSYQLHFKKCLTRPYGLYVSTLWPLHLVYSINEQSGHHQEEMFRLCVHFIYFRFVCISHFEHVCFWQRLFFWVKLLAIWSLYV
jgi:hypothetical protein